MTTPATVLETLKKDGFRLTPARMAIVEATLDAGSPVSAEQVAAALKRAKVPANITTVYRELEFLRERGVLAPVTFADGVQRYESAGLGHHHHLVCVGCDAIQDIALPHDELHAAEHQIEKTHGFSVLQHALEFYGRCAKCR